MPEFNDWFPTSRHGTTALNVMDFGAIGDGVGNALSTLGYTTLAQAQTEEILHTASGRMVGPYPSAVASDLSDTADWCAITECFKHAFSHETSPGVWVSNGTASYLNSPVFLPAGRYIIRKPLYWHNIQGAWIYGSGNGTQIYNEFGTPGESSCILANGFGYCLVENINFGTLGGEASSKAFDLNSDNGATTTVASNGCAFNKCNFSAPTGVGLAIADPASFAGAGYMGSEMSFYQCQFNNSAVGCYIANWNALNFSFIGCGGTDNGVWLQISAGGAVTVMNASLAANGIDIVVGAGSCTVLTTRSESQYFVSASFPTALIGCSHAAGSNTAVFCRVEAAAVYAYGCDTTVGRICGSGSMHLENCSFNNSTFYILTVIDSGGLIRLTHQNPYELWLDGDEVKITGVTGTGADNINGVWIIDKINSTTIDLVGSTFSGTYTSLGTSGAARIQPGPHYHLRDVVSPGFPFPTKVMTGSFPSRSVHETVTRDWSVLWLDSGGTFDNLGAAGEVIFTLPSLLGYGVRGAAFKFVVLTNQALTIKVYDYGAPGAFGLTSRIFRAGGYATAGTQITCNTIGATLEIYLADGASIGDAPIVAGESQVGHRWVVRSETGTWTISGTPA